MDEGAEFSNEPIDVSTIPRLSDEDFTPVDPNFLKVSLIGYAIWTVIVIALGVVISLLVPENEWIPLVVMAVILALTALGLSLIHI